MLSPPTPLVYQNVSLCIVEALVRPLPVAGTAPGSAVYFPATSSFPWGTRGPLSKLFAINVVLISSSWPQWVLKFLKSRVRLFEALLSILPFWAVPEAPWFFFSVGFLCDRAVRRWSTVLWGRAFHLQAVITPLLLQPQLPWVTPRVCSPQDENTTLEFLSQPPWHELEELISQAEDGTACWDQPAPPYSQRAVKKDAVPDLLICQALLRRQQNPVRGRMGSESRASVPCCWVGQRGWEGGSGGQRSWGGTHVWGT